MWFFNKGFYLTIQTGFFMWEVLNKFSNLMSWILKLASLLSNSRSLIGRYLSRIQKVISRIGMIVSKPYFFGKIIFQISHDMREKHRWCSTWCKYKVWIWCLLEPISTVQVQRRCIPIVIIQRWISLSIRTMAILRSSIVQIVFQIEDKINFVLDFCSVQFLLAEKFSVKVEQFT